MMVVSSSESPAFDTPSTASAKRRKKSTPPGQRQGSPPAQFAKGHDSASPVEEVETVVEQWAPDTQAHIDITTATEETIEEVVQTKYIAFFDT